MEHKTWGKSLNDTLDEVYWMASNIEYCEKEFLLTSCHHYLREYKELLESKNKKVLYTIDMTKRDIAISFCKNIKTGDMDYLQNCQDNLRLLERGVTEGFEGCPMNYGLDNCIEMCGEDERDYIPNDEMDVMCKNCWKYALDIE